MRGVLYTFRLLRIVWVLLRWDAVFLVPSPTLLWLGKRLRKKAATPLRPGERLSEALQALGASFIKLGQVLATRADLLGEAVARDLTTLQDRLPPFPSEKAIQTIETELGKPLSALYRDFDHKPVAAASIAQVHKATTLEGDSVAVKVVRPGVRQQFARDLLLFAWIARRLEGISPLARRLKLVQMVAAVRQTLEMETNLRYEAAAADELRENCEPYSELYIPRIDWLRSSQSVLTLEWLDGIRIDQREALIADGFDPDAILRVAAATFFRQVYIQGYFHADLHPGNIFVLRDGRLAALDFGMMGRLSDEMRFFLARMLQGFLKRDYRQVAEVHVAAGIIGRDQSVELFAQACRSIGEPIINKPINEISIGLLLGQLFSIAEQFQMQTQPQLLLLQKSLVVAEGLGWALNPSVNMWELARPLIEEYFRKQTRPSQVIRTARKRLDLSVTRAERLLGMVEERLEQPRAEQHKPTGSTSSVGWLVIGVVFGALLTFAALGLIP